jgi:hypothetical protein
VSRPPGRWGAAKSCQGASLSQYQTCQATSATSSCKGPSWPAPQATHVQAIERAGYISSSDCKPATSCLQLVLPAIQDYVGHFLIMTACAVPCCCYNNVSCHMTGMGLVLVGSTQWPLPLLLRGVRLMNPSETGK